MADDENFAQSVPERLNGVDGISEKAMFGGLAFLLHRNVAVEGPGVFGDLLEPVDCLGHAAAGCHWSCEEDGRGAALPARSHLGGGSTQVLPASGPEDDEALVEAPRAFRR
jgi:hypothetical protein